MATHSNPDDPTHELILGPVKIFDGLFMGDELAAKDIQFIISNKVTHVINTVVHRIPNLWENFCIHYLSVGWTEKETNIFDKKDNALIAVCNFIQQAQEKGQSCLVHSIHGKSRACAIIVAFLMKKFKWSLAKCLQFVDHRKENLHIRINYLSQLESLEQRLKKQHPLSQKWQYSNTLEEKIINNTYKNSLSSRCSFPYPQNKSSAARRIEWRQQNNKIHQKEDSVSHQPPPHDFILKPILKETHLKEDYGFYKPIKQQDNLDRILFESSRKNIFKEDKNSRSTRNTTLKMGSLEKMQLLKQQSMTMKKTEHYSQVLASYHGISDDDIQISQVSSMKSIYIKESREKDKRRKNQNSRESERSSSEQFMRKRKPSPKKVKRSKNSVSYKIKHDFN